MPTVIDSLVVELGLDPKKFTQGQKDAIAAFKKTQEEAVSGAKSIEAQAAKTEAMLGKVQSRFLALLSLFVGGKGLKDFIVDTTKVNAETGRTAQLFETTTKALSAWRTVANLTGGSAQGMTSAIGGLITQFQNFALTGESNVIPYFRALNIDIADTTGKMRSMDDIMLDLADRFSKLDPAKARAFGQALGFDEATISLLLRGRAAVKGLLDEAKTLGTVTKEDAEASAKLVKEWNAMEASATHLGRTILTALTPAITKAAQRWTEIFKEWSTGQIITPGSFIDKLINPPRNSSGAEPSEVWGGPAKQSLRSKGGAGTTSLATAALAHSLQSEIPGIDRFTAFNDTYHALLGRGSAHQRGQAVDFTLKDKAQSVAVAAQVRQKLAEMGIDATVIDEYSKPSRGSTGGHIHVQFNSAGAAARYAELASNGQRGAGAVSNSSSSSSSQVTIGKIEVVTQATDAPGIAKDIKPAIERHSFATQANNGPN